MRARYLGPLIVITRNRGGAYIVAELDGSVFDRPVAAFRVVPYFAQTKLNLPLMDQLLNISQRQLQQLKDSETVDLDKVEDDFQEDND